VESFGMFVSTSAFSRLQCSFQFSETAFGFADKSTSGVLTLLYTLSSHDPPPGISIVQVVDFNGMIAAQAVGACKNELLD
jgi:hypothetical protein